MHKANEETVDCLNSSHDPVIINERYGIQQSIEEWNLGCDLFIAKQRQCKEAAFELFAKCSNCLKAPMLAATPRKSSIMDSTAYCAVTIRTTIWRS